MFKKARRRSKQNRSNRSTGSNNSSSVGTLRGILKLPPSHVRENASVGDSSIGSRSTITTLPPRDGPRKVGFTHVTIREFERTLGDNPSCSSGAPISIGWNHLEDRTHKIDEYEEERPPRRDQPDLVLSRQEREELLVEWGASFQDIIDSIRNGIRIKNQRRSTVNAIGRYDRWEEMMESAGRRIKRTIGLQRQYVPMVPPPTHRPDDSRRNAHHPQHRHHHHRHSHGDEHAHQVEHREDDGLPKMPKRRVSSDSPVRRAAEKATRELLDSVEMVNIAADYEEEEEDGQAPPSLVESSAMSDISPPTANQTAQPMLSMQESFLSYDSKRPTAVIEVDPGAESCDTSLHSLQSGLTEPEAVDAYWDDGDTFSSDGFGKLERNTSHWVVGGTDAPRVLRCHNPLVINEDGMYDTLLPPAMENWQYQGFSMQPPPFSNSIIRDWE